MHPGEMRDRTPAVFSRRRPVFILGSLSLAAWVGLAFAGDLARKIPLFLGLYGALFAAYTCLLVLTRCGERLEIGRGLRAMVVFAVLFRTAAALAPPSLSPDLYRYLWDGRVLVAGVNPYRYAPDAPEVVHLRDEHYSSINHRELPTIYPATAQLVFAAVAMLWPHPSGIKVAMALMDILILAALASLLAARRLPRGRLLVYAWCPLPILEFAGMGHVDAIGIALLVAALAAFARARYGRGLAALGGAILGKLFPLLLVPAFLSRSPRRSWIVLPLLLIVGVVPFLTPGVDPTTTLRTFIAKWRGNDVLFAGLLALTGSLAAAKVAALFLVVLTAALCHRRASLEMTALAVMAAALLLSPVLHPWYITWIVPLLAVRPSVAGIAWTGSIALAYLAWSRFHATGEYAVAPAIRALELALPLAAQAGAWRAGRRRAGADASGELELGAGEGGGHRAGAATRAD